MAKPFDATIKTLITDHPEVWARFFGQRYGIPLGEVTLWDSDLSLTQQADKLFRIEGTPPNGLHLEFESSGRRLMAEDLLRYHIIARRALGGAVQTVVVALRPKADRENLTGVLELPTPDGSACIIFRYGVIQLWRESFEAILSAGPLLAPLALLTDEAAENPVAAADRLVAQLYRDGCDERTVRNMFGSAMILSGLRYDRNQIEEMQMSLASILEESVTYQMLIERGMAKGIAMGEARGKRTTLLKLGTLRFGPPAAEIASAIHAIDDLERLDRMTLAVLTVQNWIELLAIA